MDVVRYIAEETGDKYQRAALVLRTMAWLSIVWGFVTAIWIGTGFKAGSNLWLWWTIGQFAFGAICLTLAKRFQTRASRRVLMPEEDEVEIHERAA